MNAVDTQPILLVDDDKFLLDMYSTKFREEGKVVEVCFGGAEALEKLREGLKPVAVILDVVMPNPDGLEVLETIKKEKLGGDPMVIMLSNQGEQRDINRAKELGADGYIVKASAIPSEVLEQVDAIIKGTQK